MSESERTLVRQGTKQGRRPSIAEMQARIGVLEADLAAASEREAATAEVLRERTDELAARNSEFGERIEQQSATIDVLKAMSASRGDPQPVFDLIVRRARDLCNCTSAGWLPLNPRAGFDYLLKIKYSKMLQNDVKFRLECLTSTHCQRTWRGRQCT
jgi:hypothetical protein